MTTLPIDEVATQLAELIRTLAPGEEIIIVDGDSPVAKVSSMAKADLPVLRRLASAETVTATAVEDEPVNDFARYMT
jgi:antitoxin (DNA-binding transcriptional repressor) of toxin-antitoxin stability system